tara:strand:- start:292 stop:573 length:282 start_codon:yes stop_codon:yes gene_type:complete
MAKETFVSKQTGEVWQKEAIKNYKKWFEKVAVLTEDHTSKGKNNKTTVLEKGSKVLIIDIRGRIHPQYKVKDKFDRLWFIPSSKIEILKDEEK